MTVRHSFLASSASAMLAIALCTGCNKSQNAQAAPTDQQLQLDVQSKLLGDSNVPNKQMTINANNGIVTLAGQASSEAERNAAAADAASVAGVKTVVNDLTLSNATTQQPPQSQPEQQPVAAERHRGRSSAGRRDTTTPATVAHNDARTSAPVPNFSDNAQPTQQAQATPPPPPAPVKLTVPAGTTLGIRINQPLSSNGSQTGDSFKGELTSDVMVDDQVAIPHGAEVTGRVVSAAAAGRFEGRPELSLALYQIGYNGHQYAIATNSWDRQGNSRGKNTAEKVGGGAAVGAILGGIFGGGKGAAIGAASGGGLGAGAQTIQKAQQVVLESESVLQFQLQSPITVTASNSADRGRQKMDTNPQSDEMPPNDSNSPDYTPTLHRGSSNQNSQPSSNQDTPSYNDPNSSPR